jgi:hypothetical protein
LLFYSHHFQGGLGCAKDVSYRNITVNNVQQPILVDQFYNQKGSSGGVSGTDLKAQSVTDIPRVNKSIL